MASDRRVRRCALEASLTRAAAARYGPLCRQCSSRQRSERKKWLSLFEGVNVLVFVVAISECASGRSSLQLTLAVDQLLCASTHQLPSTELGR